MLMIICLCILTSCSKNGDISFLNERYDLNLPNMNLLYYNFPHTFHGDGVYYYVFQVEEEQKSELFENDLKTDREMEKYIKDVYRFVLSKHGEEPVPEEFLLDFDLPYSYFYKTSGDGPFTCPFDETIKYRELCYFLYFESSETLYAIRKRT